MSLKTLRAEFIVGILVPTRPAPHQREAMRELSASNVRGELALDVARQAAALDIGIAQPGDLHAGVVIAEHDRCALERLCRYGARPAFAQDRLAWVEDGRISYKLERPWPDGRTHLVLEPVAFLRRLVGIIPPPRRHLVRYAGVFGPASKHQAKLRALVPATDADDAATSSCPGSASSSAGSSRARRLPWADLLRRVFADDVLQCPCGGRRSGIAIVANPTIARTLLTTLGLPNEPATFAPARAPPRSSSPGTTPRNDADASRSVMGAFGSTSANVSTLTSVSRSSAPRAQVLARGHASPPAQNPP